MKTFEEFLSEGMPKTGDWISMDGNFAIVVSKDKVATPKSIESIKDWKSAKSVDMKKVPPKVQDKIMAKAEKYL